MKLHKFGYRRYFNKEKSLKYSENEIARIVRQDKERYRIVHASGILEGIPTGKILYGSSEQGELPVVGDWVKVTPMDDKLAVIHEVIERKNWLERKAVSSESERQVMAANIDAAVIMQAVGQDLNFNRMERYLSIIKDQKITPHVIINKTDLLSKKELDTLKSDLNKRFSSISFHFLSCMEQEGVREFEKHLEPEFTYCFLGSSGVGKSTLLNILLKKELQSTNEISASTNKGKHTTTRREMFATENGALIIDTPGMRELGLTSESEIEDVFPKIRELAKKCHFNDCSHENEPGCAVLEALESGIIDQEQYENFIKMRKEQEHYSRSVAEKRKRGKEFAKMVKEVKSTQKKLKR